MKIVTTSDGGDVELTIKMWVERISRNGNQVTAIIYMTARPTSDWGDTTNVWHGQISDSSTSTWIAMSGGDYEKNGWTSKTWTINDTDTTISYSRWFSWANNSQQNQKNIKITDSFAIPSITPQQLYIPAIQYRGDMDNDGWIHYDFPSGSSRPYVEMNYGGMENNRIQSNTNYAVVLEIESISGASIGIENSSSYHPQLLPIDGTTYFNTAGTYIILCSSSNDSSYSKLLDLRIDDLQSGGLPTAKFRVSVIEDTDVTIENFVYQPYVDTNTVVKRVKSAFGNEAKIGTEAQYVAIGNGHSLQYWLDETPSILGGIAAPTSDIGKNGDIYIEYEGIE